MSDTVRPLITASIALFHHHRITRYIDQSPSSDLSIRGECGFTSAMPVSISRSVDRSICPKFPCERAHCVLIDEQVPIRWPASRDEIWQANVPHTFLATEKSDQHWMVVHGDKVNFPGGGTHFPNGADKYIAHLAKVSIPRFELTADVIPNIQSSIDF